MNLRSLALGLALVAAIPMVTPAQAVPITGAKMVDGQEAFQRVTKLTTEIPWYSNLEYAQKLAQKDNKPIFWMHMLGPLNGKT